MCNFVFPLTTIGKIDVFNISSVELYVSVIVFKAGVACVFEAITTAGNVSILELKSVKSALVNSGPEDVKIFSGAGIVSVRNRGLDEVVVGLMLATSAVGLIVLVNVLKINQKYVLR